MLTSLRYIWPLVLCFCLEKRQPPEKGFLFGYPIVFKKRNGIMVNAETLAGGLYKLIYDYLIISHSLWDWELGNLMSVRSFLTRLSIDCTDYPFCHQYMRCLQHRSNILINNYKHIIPSGLLLYHKIEHHRAY